MAAGVLIAGIALTVGSLWSVQNFPGIQNISDPDTRAVAESFARLSMGALGAGWFMMMGAVHQMLEKK